jgi:CubicO group peptidase (beta-lactamase class C family)
MMRVAANWRLAASLLLATSCASESRPPAASPTPVAPVATVDPSGDWDLRWDRGFSKWKPSMFEGRLTLRHEAGQWTGHLWFKQSPSTISLESLRVDGDRIELVLRWEINQEKMELSGFIREGRLIGEIRADQIPWTSVAGRRVEIAQLRRASVEHSLPAKDVDAGETGASQVRAILDHAAAENSSAVVIVKDGKIAVEAYRDGYEGTPIAAMSASKSIVSLAIGLLIAEGRLSLDTTMGSLFPEWQSAGPKSQITVQQLLTHTSGLDPSRASFATETIAGHALKSKLAFSPGARFQYNNDAVDFLAVVFKRAAGTSLDQYVEKRLFAPLDIVGARWETDSAGVPRAAGELIIRPVDLAKIGQLLLDDGLWRGERIVPREWIARSIEAGQPFDESCGLLWWREGTFATVATEEVLGAWRDGGLDESIVRSARALVGRRFPSMKEYRDALRKAIGPGGMSKLDSVLRGADHIPFSANAVDGPSTGFSARGWLGQYLVVFPKTRVVAVRMREAQRSDYAEGSGEADGYSSFADEVSKLP